MEDRVKELVLAATGETSIGTWHSINCPFCSDRRRRGGFFITSGGGFRYKCFNGGCDYTTPTGWEPDSLLSGRARELFEKFGVTPPRTGNPHPVARLRRSGYQKPTLDFKELQFPEHSPLFPLDTEAKQAAFRYLESRSKLLPYMHEYILIDRYPGMVFMLFRHAGKPVGYLGRRFAGKSNQRFMVKLQRDYVPFMERITDPDDDKPILITESAFDAVLIGGVASLSSSPPRNLKLLLMSTERRRIVVADNDLNDESIYKAYAPVKIEIVRPPEEYHDIGDMIQDVGCVKTMLYLNSMTCKG